MRDEVVVEQLEIGLRDLAVAVPPDRALGQRIDDGMLVLGAAAGVDAGLGADRPALDEGGLAAGDGVLVELRRIQIPVDRSEVLKAEFVSAVGAVPQTRFLHESLHSTPAAAGTPPGAVSTAQPALL